MYVYLLMLMLVFGWLFKCVYQWHKAFGVDSSIAPLREILLITLLQIITPLILLQGLL